jgi:hypothetical protein
MKPESCLKEWFSICGRLQQKNKLFFIFASSLFMDSQFLKKERKRIEFARYLYAYLVLSDFTA